MNTIREVCNWKGLVAQEDLYAKLCIICQYLRKRKTRHEHIPPKIIIEINTWDFVHIDLIFSYTKYII